WPVMTGSVRPPIHSAAARWIDETSPRTPIIAGRLSCGRSAASRRADFGSVDDLIGAKENGRRDGEPERPRGFQVDDQFQFAGLQNRELRRFSALENASGVSAGLVPDVVEIGAVTQQAALRGEVEPTRARQAVMSKKRHYALLLSVHEGV